MSQITEDRFNKTQTGKVTPLFTAYDCDHPLLNSSSRNISNLGNWSNSTYIGEAPTTEIRNLTFNDEDAIQPLLELQQAYPEADIYLKIYLLAL